ncbi:glycosyl hydrolase family 38 protein [Teladorsagia circumcincta]|uniref:Glycosyl hydrolase family 38 protein n=1 Tax=Teladorsagia circumcincta TaxID=45464 RepID=A0A2G9U5M0_TELCI|nr:glycosyl hydrolase family 38 protein [Teladorsagia circumcincta]
MAPRSLMPLLAAGRPPTKLEQLFGECGKPETAWQIDPFGHSKEQANLFAMILAGAFFQGNYEPPKGFCFDALCGDDPIMDNPDLEGYNLDEKISAFVEQVKRQASRQYKLILIIYIIDYSEKSIQASSLRSSHVMLLMGSDFQYTNANTWYTNLDKLIQYVNGNATHGLHVFYSTPSCYVKGLTESSATRLPTKDDDFFP